MWEYRIAYIETKCPRCGYYERLFRPQGSEWFVCRLCNNTMGSSPERVHYLVVSDVEDGLETEIG